MSSETKPIFIPTLSSMNYRCIDEGGTYISVSEHGELVQEWNYTYEEPINRDDFIMGTKESHYTGTSVIYPEHVSEISLSKRFITDDSGPDGENLYLWRISIYGTNGQVDLNFPTRKRAEPAYQFILDWKRKYAAK